MFICQSDEMLILCIVGAHAQVYTQCFGYVYRLDVVCLGFRKLTHVMVVYNCIC